MHRQHSFCQIFPTARNPKCQWEQKIAEDSDRNCTTGSQVLCQLVAPQKPWRRSGGQARNHRSVVCTACIECVLQYDKCAHGVPFRCSMAATMANLTVMGTRRRTKCILRNICMNSMNFAHLVLQLCTLFILRALQATKFNSNKRP